MATLDVVTLSEAKATLSLNEGETRHDDRLRRLITAVSLQLDELVGPVVNRTITGELHDGGDWWITPRFTPMSSISSLVEYVSTTAVTLAAETNASKPANGYVVESDWVHDVRVRRRSGDTDLRFECGRRNIALSYVAGRAATTAAVDGRFKEAAGMTLLHLWTGSSPTYARSQQFGDRPDGNGSPVPGWLVPRAVLELLSSDLRPGVSKHAPLLA